MRLTVSGNAVLIGLVCVGGCSKPVLGPTTAHPATSSAPTGGSWDWSECLHANVREGRVHYARLSAHPETLDRVLTRLAVGDEPDDNGPRLAAELINAYNAFAMRAGLERYRAAGGDPNRARAPGEDEFRFTLHRREVTLVDIRHRLLRGKTPDVRILFALCPAREGTPLHDQPFESATLDKQLSAVSVAAMQNPDVVQIDHENKSLRLTNMIGREQSLLIGWYRRRTGAGRAVLLNALLDLADDAGRDLLNTAIGYPVVVRPPQRRLNVYVPAGP